MDHKPTSSAAHASTANATKAKKHGLTSIRKYPTCPTPDPWSRPRPTKDGTWGGSATWPTTTWSGDVYCTKAGRYNLAIRYATAENRAFEVAANGKSYGFLDDLNSGAWDSNWDIANIEVNLNAGYNTIRLGEPASFAPNVDYIELTLLEETGIILDGSLRGGERSEGWGLRMNDESNNPSSLISHPSSVYDLQGRVGGGPGIVIVNGKKILTHK